METGLNRYYGTDLPKDVRLRPTSLKEDMKEKLVYHQQQIRKIEKILALLEANPAIGEFVDLSREL